MKTCPHRSPQSPLVHHSIHFPPAPLQDPTPCFPILSCPLIWFSRSWSSSRQKTILRSPLFLHQNHLWQNSSSCRSFPYRQWRPCLLLLLLPLSMQWNHPSITLPLLPLPLHQWTHLSILLGLHLEHLQSPPSPSWHPFHCHASLPSSHYRRHRQSSSRSPCHHCHLHRHSHHLHHQQYHPYQQQHPRSRHLHRPSCWIPPRSSRHVHSP
mmetsp:Transcript_15451/g.33456  ORF Transcript_15451/g.33456 Transcript_15451/m.33456 type:complete len:210 (-) Transcript_15451:1273-1902(-)